MGLIPTIEIGKRYLWRAQLVEYLCPSCGYTPGTGMEGDDNIVSIASEVKDYGCVTCPQCDYVWAGAHPGWYTCFVKGRLMAVPYPQLHKIEGEVYDTA